MKLEFSRQIFEKYSNTKFHENPSGGSGVILMRTDGRGEDDTRFLQFLPTRQKTSRLSAESASDLRVKRHVNVTITFFQVRLGTFAYSCDSSECCTLF